MHSRTGIPSSGMGRAAAAAPAADPARKPSVTSARASAFGLGVDGASLKPVAAAASACPTAASKPVGPTVTRVGSASAATSASSTSLPSRTLAGTVGLRPRSTASAAARPSTSRPALPPLAAAATAGTKLGPASAASAPKTASSTARVGLAAPARSAGNLASKAGVALRSANQASAVPGAPANGARGSHGDRSDGGDGDDDDEMTAVQRARYLQFVAQLERNIVANAAEETEGTGGNAIADPEDGVDTDTDADGDAVGGEAEDEEYTDPEDEAAVAGDSSVGDTTAAMEAALLLLMRPFPGAFTPLATVAELVAAAGAGGSAQAARVGEGVRLAGEMLRGGEQGQLAIARALSDVCINALGHVIATDKSVPCERCLAAGRTGAAQRKRRAAHFACAQCAYTEGVCPACQKIIRLDTFAPWRTGLAAACAVLTAPEAFACAVRLARADGRKVYAGTGSSAASGDSDDGSDDSGSDIEDEVCDDAGDAELRRELRQHFMVMVKAFAATSTAPGWSG